MPTKKEIRSAARREEKRKNRVLIYIGVVLGISLLIAAFAIPRAIMAINENLVLELEVDEYDISSVPDGEYFGNYESTHLAATVSVTISGGRMTDFELLDYYGIDAKRAQTVFEAVKEYQMLNVPDENIGSEPTDKIVLKAISSALSMI